MQRQELIKDGLELQEGFRGERQEKRSCRELEAAAVETEMSLFLAKEKRWGRA
jgi:hypothetical protein